MENNDIRLSELKKEALTQVNKGEPIMEDNASTVGANWAEKLVAQNNDPSTNEVYIPPEAPVETNNFPTIEEEPETLGLVLSKEEIENAQPKEPEMLPPGEPINFKDNLNSYLQDYDQRIEEQKQKYEEHVTKVENPTEETEDEDSETFNTKYNEAVVIIDKSKMGSVVNFTEEEHKKLEMASKITLQEIETLPLKTIKTKKIQSGKNSPKLIENIIERKQSVNASNIVLPASGYTAVMKGCTPYELMEMVADGNNEIVNQESRWSLIYRKLESTSLGKMSFNEFLQNTANTDYNVLLFGILCATYPSDDKFPLTCQTEGCKKPFEHHYSVKSLIRAEKMSPLMVRKFQDIIDNSYLLEDAKKLHSAYPVMELKRIQLPVSGYIIDVSIQSAYDYIYKAVKEMKDRLDSKYHQASVAASIIRKLNILDDASPVDDPEYYEFDSFTDITKAVYSLHATDLKILYQQAQKLFQDSSFEFGLMNVICPHCRTVTNSIPIDVENVLFYRYHQEVSKTIV
jgi:hypothetical protein